MNWFFCHGFPDKHYFHTVAQNASSQQHEEINDVGNNIIQHKNGKYWIDKNINKKNVSQIFFDKYDSTKIYFQEDLNIIGFISRIENRNWGSRSEQLTQYVLYHYENYNAYFSSVFGENKDYPLNDIYMQNYIIMNNLEDDLNKFVNENPLLFNNKDEEIKMIEKMIENIINPIFDQTRYLYIYIYRETDRKGICVWRESLT